MNFLSTIWEKILALNSINKNIEYIVQINPRFNQETQNIKEKLDILEKAMADMSKGDKNFWPMERMCFDINKQLNIILQLSANSDYKLAVEKFKNSCIEFITTNAKQITEPQFKKIIGNALLAIVILGLAALVLNSLWIIPISGTLSLASTGINKWLTGSWLFFETDLQKKIQGLKRSVEQLHTPIIK